MRNPRPAPSMLLPAVLAAVVMSAVLALGGSSRPAYALTNCDITVDLGVDAEEMEFLRLINAYRAANGAGALTISANLNRAATRHSSDMAMNNYFSHTDLLGRNSNKRMKDCGATVPGSGENIAAGTSWDTAAEVFNAWKNSSGHNTNMLRSTYKQIGISRFYWGPSRYDYYWTTDFSTVNDGTNLGGSAGGGGGGALATATPTRTPAPSPTPTTSTKAAMISPAPGATFPGASVTFTWSSATGAKEYFLYVGTSAGSNNVYGRSQGLGLSRTVTNLPAGGRTLYVRLWTKQSNDKWAYTDYTYRAAP